MSEKIEAIYNDICELLDNRKYSALRDIIIDMNEVDIAELIAPAKLFVGVSRAALEAMAEEKPCIVAGNEGYIGLFDESKVDVALATNFCCRGCADSTSEQLAQDIGEFFGMWEEDRAKIGAFGRQMIIDNYSVKRMTDDTESIYSSVLK